MEVGTHLLRRRLTSILCAGSCWSEQVIAVSRITAACVVPHTSVCIYTRVYTHVFRDIQILMFPYDLLGGIIT